ncbi:hypothetical protein V6N12_073338 [Hibiscus sabdariffa]
MITVHELPFAFTEYEVFTLLMKSANPHYVKISRATTKDDCWKSYEVEKRRLNGLLKTVAILDPRNKMKLINFSFCVMYSEDEAPRQIRMVRNSLYELYKEYVDEYATANVNTTMESDVQESGVINTCTTSRIGKGKVLTGRSKFERCIRSVDRIHNVKSELDIYLGEGMFICKEECIDFDALEWWKANNLKF